MDDSKKLEYRATIDGLVKTAIFCPHSGNILDRKTAVLIQRMRDGRIVEEQICDPERWRIVEDVATKAVEDRGETLVVVKAADLWKKN